MPAPYTSFQAAAAGVSYSVKLSIPAYATVFKTMAVGATPPSQVRDTVKTGQIWPRT